MARNEHSFRNTAVASVKALRYAGQHGLCPSRRPPAPSRQPHPDDRVRPAAARERARQRLRRSDHGVGRSLRRDLRAAPLRAHGRDGVRRRPEVRAARCASARWFACEAKVTAVFRTSMEIEIIVEGEDATTGRRWPCVDARVTFVAIDDRAQARRRCRRSCSTPTRSARRRRRARRAAAVDSRRNRPRNARERANENRRHERSTARRHSRVRSSHPDRPAAAGQQRRRDREARRSRRRRGHAPRLALQQALERQAALPRGARRQRGRAGGRLQGRRRRPSSSRAPTTSSRSRALEVVGTVKEHGKIKGSTSSQVKDAAASSARRRAGVPDLRRRSTAPTS